MDTWCPRCRDYYFCPRCPERCQVVFMLTYLNNYRLAQNLLSLIILYLEKFLQETPVSPADQLLIENPKAGYIRPLGFLFLDSDERRR